MTNLTAVTNQGENGECGKNLPWVWRIFKFHAKRGPLESGDFDENREHDENIADLQAV